MARSTDIEWCDATFNGWIGCTKVGPGCDHCYAEVATPARRFGVRWGSGQARRRTSEAYWDAPRRWNAQPFYTCGCGYRGTYDELTTNAVHRCDLKFHPTRRRVFCASLADVLDNEVEPAWRNDLWLLIQQTPNLDWLLLTKRIGNVAKMLPVMDSRLPGYQPWSERWPWHNVWLGATICNQAEADRDIPKLLGIPAAVKFLSLEPLLGPVDLVRSGGLPPVDLPFFSKGASLCTDKFCRRTGPHYPREFGCRWGLQPEGGALPGLDWIIAGGESGPKARPAHPDWIRLARDQCAAAGIPFLFKQWGHWAPDETHPHRIFVYQDGETDIPDWRIADPACNGETAMAPLGKKNAGRTLDGIEHNAIPEIAHAKSSLRH